jgi:hypothetical protein
MKVFESRFLDPVRSVAGPIVGLTLALALSGCGSAEDTVTVKRNSNSAKPAIERSPDLDLVSAVMAAGGKAPAGLKFELTQRPVIHESFGLRVQVTPTEAVEKLQVTFESGAGLELIDAAPAFQLGKTAAGTPAEHRLGLRSAQAGVYELRATVTAEIESGGSESSSFSIPVIVSTAAADPPAGK